MIATIWHNPGCGTSCKTLEILEKKPGIALKVIEYKKIPFEREKLLQLFADSGLSPRQALRVRGTNAAALGLTEEDSSDEQILDAMLADAMLVERPFVETEKGVRLCRPQHIVQEIL